MPRAFILGGTGAIGSATARRLRPAGWDVAVTGRDPARMPAELSAAEVRFVPADETPAAFGDGADLLVDCRCFTGADAESLLPLARDATSTVMVSSKAVYVDGRGNHANSDESPRFDGPIRETQPTLAPGGGDFDTREGYGPNKVAAERVLLDSGLPVTVLRPSKVHGAASRRPREWVFVRRVLDRRPAVFLARRGEGVDHTTAAANVAALIEVVAARPGARILNSADPDAPSALEIARAVARHLGHEWDEVLVGDASLGAHPWDVRAPIVLDTTAAVELGYEPVGDYATTVVEELDWLVADASARPADDDPFFAQFFDYDAEDRYLASTSTRSVTTRTRSGRMSRVVPEAPLEQTDDGLVPNGEGWFVLNAREARWYHAEGRSAICDFEGRIDFPQVGVNVGVLEPGQPMARYHWEADQEDFLVVSGEAVLVVEGQERPLRAWDFVHCPPGTKHVIVGAGDGPCVVVAAGAREHDGQPDWGGYTVDETARRHGASVEQDTTEAAEAYAGLTRRQPTRYRDGWLPEA